MAIQNFYSTLADTDLAKDVIAKDPDFYIQRYLYKGTAVYTYSTAGDEIFTFTAQSWTDDDLISTVARNLIVYDANSKAATAKIKDNTTTTVSFDGTDLLLEEDGVTPATLVDGNTYDIYILTPSSTAGFIYGPYAGYIEGVELSITDSKKVFKYGLPRKKKFSDLEEREAKLTGGIINWSNEDWLQAILGATQYGKQTDQFSYGIGVPACGSTENLYRMAFKLQDRNCRTIWLILRQLEFLANGNLLGKSADGYAMMKADADLFYDGFYPDTAALLQIIRSDT